MSKFKLNHNPQHILVTGGAGFIGSNFVHFVMDMYPSIKVTVLDLLTYAGNVKNLKSVKHLQNFEFVKGDIKDQQLVEQILKEKNVDTIVHFAAESHVDRSILGANSFIQTNVVGTLSLLEAAKKVWLDTEQEISHRFHHVSTDEVYGSLEASDNAFSESHQYQPNSPYSASKAASDHLVRAYHHTYGLNVTTSNCSNNYGPYHFPEKLIPLAITNILNNKNIPIYGDGMQIRDWLHVNDHCRGIFQVVLSGEIGEVYNIGGNNEWANIDIIKLLCQLVNEKFKSDEELKTQYPLAQNAISGRSEDLISYVEDRLGHDRRYAIDNSKISKELAYKPLYTFESGLKETLQWYLDNTDWWQELI